MNEKVESSIRGLSTIAFLKAQRDEGRDHLGIFMPFLEDALSNKIKGDFVRITEVRAEIIDRHGIDLPIQLITELFGKASKSGVLTREYGTYKIARVPSLSIDLTERTRIERSQQLLGQSFVDFALREGTDVGSPSDAMNLIFGFLAENDSAVLLNAHPSAYGFRDLLESEEKLAARYIQEIVLADTQLSSILSSLMEGLVVYRTAYLSDFDRTRRRLDELHVYLDTRFLFQVLGHEDDAAKIAARESLQLMRDSGITVRVFDQTVKEMRNILGAYEQILSDHRRLVGARPHSMLANFVRKRYAPSDIAQISGLLTEELNELGMDIVSTPRRNIPTTLDEKKLVETLSDPKKNDGDSSRVNHDVDCVAAILTMRQGKTSSRLGNETRIFATTSSRTLAGVEGWYFGQGGSGISPISSVRAISNLAWVRNPGTSTGLKLHELVALCGSILRPSRETWEKFLGHLQKLEDEKSLTSDRKVAILLTELTENYLGSLAPSEDLNEEDQSISAVIQRVESSITKETDEKIAAIREEANSHISQANIDRDEVTRALQELKASLEKKCNVNAKRVRQIVLSLLAFILVLAGLIGGIDQFLKGGILGAVAGLVTVIAGGFSFLGAFADATRFTAWIEKIALRYYRRKFQLEPPEPDHITLFSDPEP